MKGVLCRICFILTKGGAEAIPVNAFPDYLKNMMRKGNKTLEYEYEVSSIMLLFSPIIGSIQRLEDDLKPESNVARLPHNIPKNKFKNIFPCTHEMLVVLCL